MHVLSLALTGPPRMTEAYGDYVENMRLKVYAF